MNATEKAPIVFCHGFGYRDRWLGLRYWGCMPELLERRGHPVFVASYGPFSPVDLSVKRLRRQLLDWERRRGVPLRDALFVGHSKGGLVTLEYFEKYGSLGSTRAALLLNPPIEGLEIARKSVRKYPGRLYRLLDVLGLVMGDASCVSERTVRDFTVSRVPLYRRLREAGFRIDIVECRTAYENLEPMWRLIQRVGYGRAQTGDGLVEAIRAIPETGRLVLRGTRERPLNHISLLGLPRFLRGRGIDPYRFIMERMAEIEESRHREALPGLR